VDPDDEHAALGWVVRQARGFASQRDRGGVALWTDLAGSGGPVVPAAVLELEVDEFGLGVTGDRPDQHRGDGIESRLPPHRRSNHRVPRITSLRRSDAKILFPHRASVNQRVG